MSEGKLRVSLLLTLAFVALETAAGWRANSLALLSDAGHNFTDALALGLSWYALWVARKPATPAKTYGYHRVGILTALFNAVTLLVIAVFILREAAGLFFHPQHVLPLPMIGVAAIAVLLNTAIAVKLRGEAAHNVNMRSAYIHMVGDALSSVGVILAGVAIRFTGWQYADPLVSVLIALFIGASSWGILKETVNILLEGTPKGLNVDAMAAAMRQVAGVSDVHDLHVWAISDGMNALSCHLRVTDAEVSRAACILQDVKTMLAVDYSVQHSTIETECGGCERSELYCQMPSLAAHEHSHTH